jgi:hypothetical protein
MHPEMKLTLCNISMPSDVSEAEHDTLHVQYQQSMPPNDATKAGADTTLDCTPQLTAFRNLAHAVLDGQGSEWKRHLLEGHCKN